MTKFRENSLALFVVLIMLILSISYIAYLSFLFTVTINEFNRNSSNTTIIIYHVKVEEKESKPIVAKTIDDKPAVSEPITKTKEIVKDDISKKVEPKQPKVEKSVPAVKTTNGDEYLLAQIINAEAKGESYEGKIAVGNVVMNRVNNDGFPNTIEGVIFQKGQFSPVNNGSIYNTPSDESLKAAKEVLEGKRVVGSDAIYFYNPKTATSKWIFSRPTITDIGTHRFAK